jgi:hypothetical protein
VKQSNFGAFKVRKKSARPGRNLCILQDLSVRTRRTNGTRNAIPRCGAPLWLESSKWQAAGKRQRASPTPLRRGLDNRTS